MKLSSSVSCGCCFCCYCRSWLMMLLMVSSVIHVSPEMSTTTTNTNLNNYYKAMTKFTKFNTKLPSRAATTKSLLDAHNGNNKQVYPTLQPDMMATALATMQTPSSRTITTATKRTTTMRTTSPPPEQIGNTRQSLYETTPALRIEERRRDEQDLFYRSSTSGTPALTGDNYDVVIRTTDTTDSIESTETLGVAGTSNVQITVVLDGDINSDNDSNSSNSKPLKYPSMESNTSEQHKHYATTARTATTRTTQNTKHASSSYDRHRAVHRRNQNYNNGQLQRTNMAQTATVSSNPETQQYNPRPMSTSSTHVITTTSSNSNTITMDSNKVNSITESSRHMPISATTPTSSHLQRRDSAPVQLEYNQLKRPALLASSTHPLQRHSRQVTEEPVDKCRLFVEGDMEKNEFYSPDYPNNYPKNINCTRKLIAPEGKIIRLDFRNSFRIEEKEDCKFDFLEIRDGQYGFSTLLGRFCGSNFPPEITSKERYLWLQFGSDESIEYGGFTAVYEFIDRTRDAPSTDLNCTIEKTGVEGFINTSDVPKEIRDLVILNKIPLDCMWKINVTEKWKIQVKFMEFKLEKPNDCDANFLDIFPEQTVMPARIKNFCGSAGEGITSESNILHMRFYAEPISIKSSFSILFTAFRDRPPLLGCGEGQYDCEDATCISDTLKCNGHDNCKFRWDEESCKTETEGQSEHMIIIITVFGLILGGMVITFLVNCVRKIMHDQKIIREHIRQSKESKLDEMGRNSKARSRDNISIVSPRQKHSQTSLQILDDVSNRYYREMELQAKGNFKEKEPLHIMRHDMIVQTSLCSTDDSSTTTTAEPQPGACDMGCQTRESLFATGPLLRGKSKTPSVAGTGGHRSVEGVPPPPRFSTFGYDAAQMAGTAQAPPSLGGGSTLSRRSIHLPQSSIDAEHPPNQAHLAMIPPQQQHRHLHQRPSQEVCHHHHQHQQQQQQHQQEQQRKHTLPRHQHQHLQEQHHHPSAVPQMTTVPATGTTIVTAISTGSSAARGRDGAGTAGPAGAGGAAKNKQSKVDESKLFIDIRNSAPDVIIMTSH